MDWTGNSGSIAGCYTRNSDAAEHDYYATDPTAMKELLKYETFSKEIWEPACGEGHLSKVLEEAGYNVYSSDLIYRGFGDPEPFDFLAESLGNFDGDIITNPPYKFADQFVDTAMEIIKTGHKVAMFLKLTFLCSSARKKLFTKWPPKTLYVFSRRVECGKNGKFEGKRGVDYAWFVWEKGFKGDPVIKWVN